MNSLATINNNNTSQALATASALLFERHNLEFFAGMISTAGLIPLEKDSNGQLMDEAKRKARVMAKIVGGVAHGFDPISSQENLHIIEGRVVLSARGMAIKLARSGKYTTRVKELNDEGCTVEVLERRNDGEWIKKGEATYTRAMAQKAGLTEKRGDMYKKYGQDMFYARAITRIVRRFAPDVLDTVTVDWRLSKDAIQPTAVQFATPPTLTIAPAPVETQSVSAAPAEVGDIYRDEVVTITEEDEAEFVEVTDDLAAEAELAELREAVEAKLHDVTGGDAAEIKKILKGKVIANEDAEYLRTLLANLDSM